MIVGSDGVVSISSRAVPNPSCQYLALSSAATTSRSPVSLMSSFSLTSPEQMARLATEAITTMSASRMATPPLHASRLNLRGTSSHLRVLLHQDLQLVCKHRLHDVILSISQLADQILHVSASDMELSQLLVIEVEGFRKVLVSQNLCQEIPESRARKVIRRCQPCHIFGTQPRIPLLPDFVLCPQCFADNGPYRRSSSQF